MRDSISNSHDLSKNMRCAWTVRRAKRGALTCIPWPDVRGLCQLPPASPDVTARGRLTVCTAVSSLQKL